MPTHQSWINLSLSHKRLPTNCRIHPLDQSFGQFAYEIRNLLIKYEYLKINIRAQLKILIWKAITPNMNILIPCDLSSVTKARQSHEEFLLSLKLQK